MKKLIAILVLVAGCRTTTSTISTTTPMVGGNQTGAADSHGAVRGFLAAAKAQDLQAMGALFGDVEGTARDRIGREELEKREIIMATCLRHDRYDIIGDAPGMAGARLVVVNLTRGDQSKSINFETVAAHDRRWYVRSFELEKLTADFCSRK